MTRFLLTIITALMFGTLFAGRDTSGVWLALVSFVQAIVIWVLSWRRGVGGTDTLDVVCLCICAMGVGLWLFFGQVWLGLLASIAADIAASAPALHKTIRLPHTELLLFYTLDIFAGLLVLAAGPYTARAMVFPAYIALVNGVFALAIWVPRLRAAKAKMGETV